MPRVVDVTRVQADTVRGVLALSGNLPLARLVLRWGTGPAEAVAVSGPSAEALAGLTGLEVMVRGQFGALVVDASPAGLRGFVVDEFVVRAGDGIPAHDGVIAYRNGTWVLVAGDGAVMAAPFLPDVLRRQEGVRVYLLGRLSEPPVGYGVVHRK